MYDEIWQDFIYEILLDLFRNITIFLCGNWFKTNIFPNNFRKRKQSCFVSFCKQRRNFINTSLSDYCIAGLLRIFFRIRRIPFETNILAGFCKKDTILRLNITPTFLWFVCGEMYISLSTGCSVYAKSLKTLSVLKLVICC